jgi:hypothetical protein
MFKFGAVRDVLQQLLIYYSSRLELYFHDDESVQTTRQLMLRALGMQFEMFGDASQFKQLSSMQN